MATVPASEAKPIKTVVEPEFRVYTHSPIFYLWPLWAVGYMMAALTLMYGVDVPIKDLARQKAAEAGAVARPDPQAAPLEVNGQPDTREGSRHMLVFPSNGPGVTYAMTLLLVLLITHVAVRGVWSLVVILTLLFLTVLFAYLGWWDDILAALPRLSVYMNLGFYVFTSTVLLIIWVFSFVVYDHSAYWRVTPGQLTHEVVVGGGQRSYDTRGMTVEKYQEDMFRHWILGFGSGDIHITTSGAKREELTLQNVLFVDYQIRRIQHLVSTQANTTA